MNTYMKAPLYLVLLMLVGAFLATPAIAQDEAAPEDTTISAQDADEAAQAVDEAAQATDEAAQATEEAAEATEEAVQATEDAAQTTEDAVEVTEDAVQTTEEAVEMTEDAEQPAQDTVTVEWIVNEAPDASSVTVKGRLVESLGDNEYVFEDETGTVQVEIDDDLLSPDQFQAGVEVEIVGEVDIDQEEGVEIEVERLNVV
jgi:uncharacterized protein (TIGR00156 family)